MTDAQRRAAAKQFAADWAGKGYEKGHSQTFWLALLQKVYGVVEPDKFINFEARRKILCKRFSTKSRILLEQPNSRLSLPLKDQSLRQAGPVCAPLAA